MNERIIPSSSIPNCVRLKKDANKTTEDEELLKIKVLVTDDQRPKR